MPVGSYIQYCTLFVALLGIGGIYTCNYVLISQVVPVSQVGGAMVLIFTIGVLASLFAPIVVLHDDPIPFLAMSASMTIAFILLYTLKIEETSPEDNQ